MYNIYNNPDPPRTTFPDNDLSQHYGRSHTVISTGCVLTMQNKVGFEVMASTWNCLSFSPSLSLWRAHFRTHTCKVHVIDFLSLCCLYFIYTRTKSTSLTLPFYLTESVRHPTVVYLFSPLPLQYWVTPVCSFFIDGKKF